MGWGCINKGKRISRVEKLRFDAPFIRWVGFYPASCCGYYFTKSRMSRIFYENVFVFLIQEMDSPWVAPEVMIMRSGVQEIPRVRDR